MSGAMAKNSIVVLIDFRLVSSHRMLVDCIAPAFELTKGDEVHFRVNLNTYSLLYPDYLLLLVSAVVHLKSTGVKVTGAFIDFQRNSGSSNYASRINFFEHLGFRFDENFTRQRASGRFTEIKSFNDANSMDVFREVMKVLIKDGINEDMLVVLQYCIWEVIDNSIRHSKSDGSLSNGDGLLCAQYFPNKREIRLIIADNGQGIHSALTSHPKSQYKHFTEYQSVQHCVDRGVTNSTGKGFGLWATATLIKENGGSLIIHSGNHQLHIGSGNNVFTTSKWKGTYTFLRLNTDVSVPYDAIFETDSQRNSFEKFKEELFGNLDELW